jgi:AraC-like DNA-binding protein
MPRSRFFTFDDPHQFQSAIRAGDYEILAKSRGGFDVELTHIDLDRLWMQGSRSGSSYIMHAANDPRRVPVLFLADAEQPPVRHNGIELSAQDLVIYRQGATNHVWLEGINSVASMSLTPKDLAEAGAAIVGHELVAPRETRIVRPAPALMARLRTLHKAACRLAKDTPEALTHPATAKALEQELVRAMVACLEDPPPKSGLRGGYHFQVIGRFEDFLAARQYEPVYLAEICAAIGVSERTLRSCCQEHLGMGPIHYLWLRRMHLARSSLLRAASAVKTVTEIATAHGFWELGRFSVEYRALFGESPSATLKRDREVSSRQKAH